MIATYQANRPADLVVPRHGGVLHAMLSDQLFRVPAIRMAEAQATWADVYAYRFDWHLPERPLQLPSEQLGAFHTLDVQFTFASLRFDWVPRVINLDPSQRESARRLARSMGQAWTAFARSGNPNEGSTGVPQWARYDRGSRATMIWGTRSRVLRAPADDERSAWDDFAFHHFVYPLAFG
jgi:para-nitrobenzyl esterase